MNDIQLQDILTNLKNLNKEMELINDDFNTKTQGLSSSANQLIAELSGIGDAVKEVENEATLAARNISEAAETFEK